MDKDMNHIVFSIKMIEKIQIQNISNMNEDILDEIVDDFKTYKNYNKKINKEWCKYRKTHLFNLGRLCVYFRFTIDEKKSCIEIINSFLKEYVEKIYE